MRCPTCREAELTPSKIRLKDVPFLALLHHPYRCWRCSTRHHMFVRRFRAQAADAGERDGPARA